MEFENEADHIPVSHTHIHTFIYVCLHAIVHSLISWAIIWLVPLIFSLQEPDLTSKSLKDEVKQLQESQQQLCVCQHAYKNGHKKTLDFFQKEFPDLTLSLLTYWMERFYLCLNNVDGDPDRVTPRQMYYKMSNGQSSPEKVHTELILFGRGCFLTLK